MKVIIFYLIIINIISFITIYIDKRKAIKNKWRISELFLVVIAILGGSLGSILGMKLFRHKTNKTKFNIGIPLILVIQIIIINYIF